MTTEFIPDTSHKYCEPLDYEALEFSCIQYNFPAERGNCKYIDILDTTNDILTFKTPELIIYDIIHKNENEKYLDLIIPEEHKKFFEFIANIDDHNMLNIYNNSDLWFNKTIPLNILDEFHRPVLKIKKSGNAIFRTSFIDNELDNLEKGDSGYFTIKLDSLKLYKREFMTNWIVNKFEKPDMDYEFGENILDNNSNFDFDIKDIIEKLQDNKVDEQNIESEHITEEKKNIKKEYKINDDIETKSTLSINSTRSSLKKKKRIIYANKQKIWN